MFRRPLIASALVLLPSLGAHDMWIEPTDFFPKPGQIVGARLRVGQELLGDPIPRSPELINQFVVDDGSGSHKPLVGRVGADPAGFLRVAAPGLHVIGYRSNPSPAGQPAGKFQQYVKEEGLEAAVAGKKIEGTVNELFARCAKSLVLSPGGGSGADHALGFTLELVAERNPYTLAAGEELPVRLTYENKPLEGALVVAINRANPSEKLSARSGKDGRVRFKLPAGAAGLWLVKAVHMVPAPAGSGDAQWMSYWASLTFEQRRASAQ